MNRVLHAGCREQERGDIDLIRYLSEVAKATREPGQTLHAAFLRAEAKMPSPLA